jgi:hypothetical protein
VVHVFVLHQIVVFAWLNDFHVHIILTPGVEVANFVHWKLGVASPISLKVRCKFVKVEAISIAESHGVYQSFSKEVDRVLLGLFADLNSEHFLEDVLHCAFVAKENMAVLVLVENYAVLVIVTGKLDFFV